LMASGLAGTGVSVVASFNASSGNYNTYIEGVSPSSNDFALSAGTGYFFYSSGNSTLVINGNNPSNPGTVINPGWNMIGWTSYNASSANALGSAMSGSNPVIARFNASTGDYDSYIYGVSPATYNFAVNPGVGYFVYSSAAAPQTIYNNNISQTQSPPVASITANVTVGTVPLTIQFTDMSIGYPTSWQWSFGDGNISTEENPVYTYYTSGTYNVSLTATNAAGSGSVVKTGYIVASPTPMGDWPEFHMDSSNSGVTTEPGPLSLAGGNATWAYNTSTASGMGAGIDTVPLIGNGKIYALAYNGYVYAFYPNGTLAWENTQIGGQDSFAVGNPVYNNGVLYVVLYMGNATAHTGIRALNTSDGSLIWSNTNFPQAQTLTPITYDNGSLYFGTWQNSNFYYCVNATTGAIVWSRNSTTGSGYYWAGSAVIGNYLVYGDDAGYLTSVYKNNGTSIESLNVSSTFNVNAQQIRSSIAYDPGTQCIFTTSQGGYIYALGFNTATGMFDTSRKWDTSIGFSTSTPAIYDGKLYVGGGGSFSSGGNLSCMNETTGSILWIYKANGIVQSSPSLSIMNGKPYIYFTSNCANSAAYCLDENGTLVWSYEPPASELQYTLCSMAISDGMAFFGNDAGYLFELKK
jgi:outer membrane protein assembly factor BamB